MRRQQRRGRRRVFPWYIVMVLLVFTGYLYFYKGFHITGTFATLTPVTAKANQAVVLEPKSTANAAEQTSTKAASTISSTYGPPPDNPPPQNTTISVVAVGDVMAHSPQIKAAWNSRTQKYDFSPPFYPVKNVISQADLAIANLETTLAGPRGGYTGYPMFNAPDALAEALKLTGFDLITTANNHSYDRGEAGVRRTIQVLDYLKLLHTGTFVSLGERDKLFIRDIKGVKIGFAAYTYGTNGNVIPKNKNYLVNIIDQQRMINEVINMKKAGADVVIAVVHFGVEYQRNPNQGQEQLVDKLISAGADVILGSHPHVLQPLQIRTVNGKQGIVAFSLGNFISNQRNKYSDTGVIVRFKITKDAVTRKSKIEGVQFIPTWVAKYYANGKTNYEVAPIVDLLAPGVKKPYLTSSTRSYLIKVQNETKAHLGSRGVK